MDSRELRIGNLLDRGDYICKVKTIEEEGLILEPINYKEEIFVERYIKPIPLTEDWLIKLGFFEKYGSCYNRWNIKLFTLIDSEDDDGNLKGEFIFNGTLEVKYVHQLQNLYFALTGAELNK